MRRTKEEGTAVAIISIQPGEIEIPTTKLGFKQQEMYRDYGHKTIEEIEEMARKMQAVEEKKYLEEHRQEIISSIMKDAIAHERKFEKIAQVVRECEDLEFQKNAEIQKINKQMGALKGKIEHLETTHEQNVRERIDGVEPLVEDFNRKRPNGLQDTTLRVDISGNNDNLYVSHRLFTDFIDEKFVDGKLREDFKKARDDDFVLAQNVKDLRSVLDEALLFNDKKIQPVFQQLLGLKRMMQSKYKAMVMKGEL